jgi:hypothetical protein
MGKAWTGRPGIAKRFSPLRLSGTIQLEKSLTADGHRWAQMKNDFYDGQN